MQLIGVGLDIIEVGRIRRLGRNPRFLPKVFTPEEIRYCCARKNRWQHLAVRFAAKEAVWKALGRGGVRWRDIGVVRQGSGRPEVRLRHKKFGRVTVLVSLSHTERYAAACAVAFKP